MNFYNSLPAFRHFLAFFAGTIFAFSTGEAVKEYQHYLFVTAGLLSFLFLFVVFNVIKQPSRYFFGILLSITFAGLGYYAVLSNSPYHEPQHCSSYTGTRAAFVFKVNNPPIVKGANLKFPASVVAIKQGDSLIPLSGSIMVYLRIDSTGIPPLSYGDFFTARTILSDIKPPANPGEFDMKRHLAINKIYCSTFIKSHQYKKLPKSEPNMLMAAAHTISSNLKAQLKHIGLSGKEYTVAIALLLGDKDELDPSTFRSFSAAGAMHVLAVSGLHVGIIYFIVSFLLTRLFRMSAKSWLFTFIVIAFLCSYAIITGLTPSVQRAVVMFCFLTIAKPFGRSNSIFNTLMISALCLLTINPYLSMHVGFQLSYFAVAGILGIQPGIARNWEPHSRIIDYFWQIISVSLAAQLATFPLGLYYFHQFPNYFLLSNLIVIPLSFLIFTSGLICYAISWIPYIDTIAGSIYQMLVYIFHTSVACIELIPLSTTDRVSLSFPELLLIYFAIISGILYFQAFRSRYLFATLIPLLIIAGSRFHTNMQRNHKSSFAIYSVSGQTAIEFAAGTENLLLVSDNIYHSRDLLTFPAMNRWIQLGIKNTHWQSCSFCHKGIHLSGNLLQKAHFFRFRNKTIAIPQYSKIKSDTLRQPIKVDYLVLSGNKPFRPEIILKTYKPATIIADASNSWYRCNKWQNICDSLGIHFHNCREKGAFLLNL